MQPTRFILATLLALPFAHAHSQQLPPPSRTVFKCEIDGKVVYSDSPCLGAQRVDVAPTRGMSKLSGADRMGTDVRQERHNEAMAEALRPVFNETAEQRAKRHHRAKLGPAERAQCAELDNRVSVAEVEEKGSAKANRTEVQARLQFLRSRYRDLKC